MDTLADLRHRLTPVLRQYGIRKAILFGSLARGEATRHSDVDLILIQQTDRRFLERYDGLLLDLNKALPHRSVDVLIYTPAELERIANRPFIAQALKEGKVLYESDQTAP